MHFVIIFVQCELIKHVFFSQVWKVVMKMKDQAVSLTSFNQQGLLSWNTYVLLSHNKQSQVE